MALWKAMEKPRSPQSKLPFPKSKTPYRRTRPDSTKIVWPGFSLYDSTFLAALDIILQEIKKLHFSLVLKAKMQLFNGAGMGTRTPTPEAREPKSRMSTNSIMPAFRKTPLFLHGEGTRGRANCYIRSGTHRLDLRMPVTCIRRYYVIVPYPARWVNRKRRAFVRFAQGRSRSKRHPTKLFLTH